MIVIRPLFRDLSALLVPFIRRLLRVREPQLVVVVRPPSPDVSVLVPREGSIPSCPDFLDPNSAPEPDTARDQLRGLPSPALTQADSDITPLEDFTCRGEGQIVLFTGRDLDNVCRPPVDGWT